jgi:4a-hydroxytetrahydrobiopterin dehydratase
MSLTNKTCTPCEGGTEPLTPQAARPFMAELSEGWQLFDNDKKIRKTFTFANFVKAMVFVNAVADIAESEGHHPDFHIHYKEVVIELWTYAIGGLSENDFIMAAKIDQLLDHRQNMVLVR